MAYNLFFRGGPAAPKYRRTAPAGLRSRGGLVISWAGMRGIVTLATAFALPVALPRR
ncbi:MAG: hypothetical protein QM702_11205 [Rubrivivax sp.]